jgi:hypothetical protein
MNKELFDKFGALIYKNYGKKADALIKELDFDTLSALGKKELCDLTEDDLFALGFEHSQNEDFDRLYFNEDLEHMKIYLSIENGSYELRGYMLRKLRDIHTTEELIHETLIKWRLKMEGAN